MFQRDGAWFVVRDDPPDIPAPDRILQHGPDELGHIPTSVDTRLAQAKAMSIFTRTIEDYLLGHFFHVDSPIVLWTSLCEACAGNTVTHKMTLRQQFFNLRFPEGNSMVANFLSLNQLIHELASVGVTFPDEDLNSCYINAFPSN